MSKIKQRFAQEIEQAFAALEETETPTLPVEEEVTEPSIRKGILQGATLVNLRKTPTMDAKVIGFVEKETEFTILGGTLEWTRIEYPSEVGSLVGWIKNQYVGEVS